MRANNNMPFFFKELSVNVKVSFLNVQNIPTEY